MSRRKVGPGQALRAGAVLCLALAAAACGSRQPADKSPAAGSDGDVDESRVVLRVGAVSFPGSAFSRYVRETVGGSVRELDALALSHLFDQFVDDMIMLQAAKEQGVTLSPEEKKSYLEKSEPGTWTEEEKASLLASDSGPLIDKIKIQKYIRGLSRGIGVADEEVGAYYEGHPDEFSLPERVQVSQILVSTEPEAVEIWEKVRFSDEEGFRATAQAQSVGPEAPSGGEMGIFQKGQLPPEMEAAIFGMPEGEVSPVVESSYGFHIFRLDRKFPPEHLSLESAAPSIRQKLLERKSEAAAARRLEELKKSLDWEIFPQYLFFPYQREEQ
jgi:parvulin-like peptidyl-prolyl isomerase